MPNIIDRHTPVIPESAWCGLTPDDERIYTLTKNKLIIPRSAFTPIRGAVKPGKNTYTAQRTITDQDLQLAMEVVQLKAHRLLTNWAIKYLAGRGITEQELEKYLPCSTELLVQELPPETVDNLTLRLPLGLPVPRDIQGISFPCWFGDVFLGFATRVLNNPSVKYAFSIPNRVCFGVDPERSVVHVCEGVFDAIALRRIGLNPLGMGDSQPNYYKMTVAARFQVINLLFDDDRGGSIGLLKAYEVLTNMCGVDPVRINILGLAGGLDPEQAVLAGMTDFRKLTLEDAVRLAQQWVAHRKES